MENEIEIVRASREDVDVMIEWAAREGWNPGLSDAECFWAADPEGFWTARIDGEMVACMSLVKFSREFAFLGFYIVHPNHRGKGIGLALWQHVTARTNPKTLVGLDAVVEEQMTYRKAGFFRAHRNIRFGGVPRIGSDTANGRDGLVGIEPAHFEAIAAYDLDFLPSQRDDFLRAWLAAPGHTAIASIRDETVSGYGVIRPCRVGHKIGPLFADDKETAERIFCALVEDAGAEEVFLDPPFANDDALELCERMGLEKVFETARMYYGLAPQLRFPGMFGITTFELG